VSFGLRIMDLQRHFHQTLVMSSFVISSIGGGH